MYPSIPITTTGWSDRPWRDERASRAADLLLRVVDAGLFGVVCVAPFFFGGRHDFGRLVLVTIIAVTSAVWFVRQAILPTAHWPRTIAYAIFLLAALLLVAQIVPLPADWITHLSPRTAELLPLWTSSDSGGLSLGAWQTLSLCPHETTKSLAMLASYGLLFAVVAGRIQSVADVRRLLNCVALAAASMAAFGVVHYFTTDGRFFWFYAHPHRSASQTMSGAFINRNHFAHFLMLGVGPLAAWLLHVATPSAHTGLSQEPRPILPARLAAWIIAAALALVTAAVLASRSRGGAVVLLVAGTVLVVIYMTQRVVDGRLLYGAVALGVVVIGLVSLHGYDQMVQRLDDLTEGSMDEIDRGGIRRAIWTANIAAFRDGWLTGSGAGSHREICPVYLPESFPKEYTHAENGYLQVATEVGIAGMVLLAAAFGVCGSWVVQSLKHAQERAGIGLCGAAAAGLAASAAHSAIDFVWFIPACMSVTIVLAACVLRLSQLVRAPVGEPAGVRELPRGRWSELAAAAIILGAWTVHTYVGPGIAAIHWDRYRRAAVADMNITREAFAQFAAGKGLMPVADRQALSRVMLKHLRAAVDWDPLFARAHKQLADRYLGEFELRRAGSANELDVRQIRDAAMASSFASVGALREWLSRAFGPDVELLHKAQQHARRTVELCPLQGGAYLQLADLSFLELGTDTFVKAYVDQAVRLRPCDRNVLADAGVQALLLGDVERAFECWSKCFNTPGSHQQRIIYRLVVSGMPASEFVARLRPDWQTLRAIWAQYRRSGRPQDLDDLLSYAAQQTQRATAAEGGIPSAYIWFWQSNLYADVGRREEALACLERAYASSPRVYAIRYRLASALLGAGRYAEAEPHVRWCLARRPADKTLNQALPIIAKQRLAQHAVGTVQNAINGRARPVMSSVTARSQRN